jgi:hypothetical protein
MFPVKTAAYEAMNNLLRSAGEAIVQAVGGQPFTKGMQGMDTYQSYVQNALGMFGKTQGNSPQGVQQALSDIVGQFEFILKSALQNYPEQAKALQQAQAQVTQAKQNLASGQEGLMGQGGTPQEAKQVGQAQPGGAAPVPMGGQQPAARAAGTDKPTKS